MTDSGLQSETEEFFEVAVEVCNSLPAQPVREEGGLHMALDNIEQRLRALYQGVAAR